MDQRLNTAKFLHNSYYDGVNYKENLNTNTPMLVNPLLSKQYDYAMTENPENLLERNRNFELAYDVFQASPFADGRFNVTDSKGSVFIKIPKESIEEVFNYMKDEMLKQKNIGPVELIIVINEFFDFNYDYVYKKVLTPQMKQALIEDMTVNNGLKSRIEKQTSMKLF